MVVKKAKVVIIGAGMAGLTAANRLYTSSPDLFDLTVVEAGSRIGGRILTADFAGDRVEMGATWIHGIGGSPVHALATELNLLEDSSCNWERMDGFPSEPVTVAEGGFTVDQEKIVDPICDLYRKLMDDARSGDVNLAEDCEDPGVGAYLRRGLRAYQASRTASTGTGDERWSLEAGDERWSLEALEEAVFAMNECTERICTSSDDLSSLNLSAESEYRDFPGDQITIAKGYSRIVEHLVSTLPPGTIRLGRQLRRVEWISDSCQNPHDGSAPVRLHFSDGTVESVDHVIVTVSLGVLKASIGKETGNGISFDPPLPDFKRAAILRLGWGVVNKLFMEIETKTEASEEEGFPFLQLVFDQSTDQIASNRHVTKIPWWIRKTESVCPIYKNSHVLLAWLAGKEATHLESLNDEEIISGLHNTLAAFLDGAGYAKPHLRDNTSYRIVGVKRSKWATDPLFLGSYSYVAVGSSGDDLDRMAEPLPCGEGVPRLQVLFAGEATHRRFYSTTHGAYYSGIRQADRLLKFYNCCNENY
ncbi:hypothetical protein LUZ60_000364 [Juncus effusus]|nr:hypothetical protein LUZ60_000364 [Juncus effusus]